MKTAAFAFLAFAFAAAAPASAQEPFDLDRTVEFCAGCHGEDGKPIEPDYPIIWGQQFFYLYTQLKDYDAGRRDNDIMSPIAARFTRSQMKEIAQAFAERPWPRIPAAPPHEGDEQAAERAITGGQCSACHGTFKGDSRIPRLAGQQAGYLERTMLDFKRAIRMNAPDKISTMKQLDDETIAALARWLAAM